MTTEDQIQAQQSIYQDKPTSRCQYCKQEHCCEQSHQKEQPQEQGYQGHMPEQMQEKEELKGEEGGQAEKEHEAQGGQPIEQSGESVKGQEAQQQSDIPMPVQGMQEKQSDQPRKGSESQSMKTQEGQSMEGHGLASSMEGLNLEERKQRVICIPCDIGETSMRTVEWAQSKLLNEGDHVILVSSREAKKQTIDQTLPKGVIDVSEVHTQKEDEKVEEILSKFKELMPGRNTELKVLRGNKREELVRYINELQPNFCVVGAREMSGLKRAFTNSTSEYLLHNLRVPILIRRDFTKSHSS